MKKILIITFYLYLIVYCQTILPSETTQPTLGQAFLGIMVQAIGAMGLEYLSDYLSNYLPETRGMKAARLQREVLEHQHEKIISDQPKPIISPIEQKDITFKDYVNPPKEAVAFVKQIKQKERYKSMDIPYPHGILITGAPGTGKTHLARAIAGEIDCPFSSYSASDFSTKWVGEGGQMVKKMFESARFAAESAKKDIAIVFVDEFDAIGKRLSDASEGSINQQQVITAFLTNMDGFEDHPVKVVVIGATNYIQNIDPALRRPGRFDKIIYISYPDEETRKRLISHEMKSKKFYLDVMKNLAEKLAAITEEASPADITALFNEAGKKAIEKNIDYIGIDYDCLAQAVWEMKQRNYVQNLPSRADQERVVNHYFNILKTTIPKEVFLSQMEQMTLNDIHNIFYGVQRFLEEHSDKNFSDALSLAIRVKNQEIKMNNNKDIAHICNNLYAPLEIDYTSEELKVKGKNDIFKEFEEKYEKKDIVFSQQYKFSQPKEMPLKSYPENPYQPYQETVFTVEKPLKFSVRSVEQPLQEDPRKLLSRKKDKKPAEEKSKIYKFLLGKKQYKAPSKAAE